MVSNTSSYPVDSVGDAATNRDQVSKFIGTEVAAHAFNHPTHETVSVAAYSEAMISTDQARDGYEKESFYEYLTSEPIALHQAPPTDAASSDTPDTHRHGKMRGQQDGR